MPNPIGLCWTFHHTQNCRICMKVKKAMKDNGAFKEANVGL